MRTFFVELWEGLQIALRAIWTHKMRSVLTTLGIIIGIAAVTAMATLLNGIERSFESSLSELGTDVLHVRKWPLGPTGDWWNYINRPEIDAELAEVIEQRSRYAVAATPIASTGRTVSYRGRTLTGATIEGSQADLVRIRAVDIARGRFFTPMEERRAARVAVIGAEVSSRLFPSEIPLGKDLRIGPHEFQVVGVLEREGSPGEGAGSADTQVKIPFSAFSAAFGTRWRGIDVQVKVVSEELMRRAADEITGIVRVARGLDAMEENNFEVEQMDDLREQLAPVKFAIYGIGIFLTALALLVGGIGVMNIMFVSVKERTREIGIRKAVGARQRAILTQFLIEAVIICLIGGALGVGVSVGLTGLINLALGGIAYLPASTVALAFGICTAIGILFGLAPAWQAARAEPIEALRYE